MFGTAGHSVVDQETASPGLSALQTVSISLCHFFYLLGLLWAVAARAPPLPLGLGIIKSFDSAAGLLRGGI